MNFTELMQQAQQHAQKLTGEIEKAQQSLADTQTTGTAGAGASKVTVSMNGLYEIIDLKIPPELFQTPDVLTDLIIAASKDAANKVRTISQKMVTNLAGSMQFPGNLQELLQSEEKKDKE